MYGWLASAQTAARAPVREGRIACPDCHAVLRPESRMKVFCVLYLPGAVRD